jgi:outer membrane protein TolC
MMTINCTTPPAMILAFLLFSSVPAVWAENPEPNIELIEGMIRIILEHNPLLESQHRLVGAGQKIPEPRSSFAISGINLTAGAGFWNTDTSTFDFIPTVAVGLRLSLGDPARSLNMLRLKREKEEAEQNYQEIKNSIISDLFTNVREILRLESQRASLEKLKAYLEDYSELVEKQVKAGVEAPELDKLWELKERALDIEVELEDVENKLSTMRLETAIRLGGSASAELLDLLWRLGRQS